MGPQLTQWSVKIGRYINSLGNTLTQQWARWETELQWPQPQQNSNDFHRRSIITALSGLERVRQGECCKRQLKNYFNKPLTALRTQRYKFYFLPCCLLVDSGISTAAQTTRESLWANTATCVKMSRPFLQSQAIHCGNITLIESHQPLHLKSWNPCATMRSGILQTEETRLLNWAAEAKHLAARWQEGTKVFRWSLEKQSLTKADTSLSITGLLCSSRKIKEMYFWLMRIPWKIISSERKKITSRNLRRNLEPILQQCIIH